MTSTGDEIISDTVKFKHHAIAVPKLTPEDRIVEAAKQLYAAIKQKPKKSPMDEIITIKLLQEIFLGEKKYPLPPNSVQRRKEKQAMQACSPETIKVPLFAISAPLRKLTQKEMSGNKEDIHTQ